MVGDRDDGERGWMGMGMSVDGDGWGQLPVPVQLSTSLLWHWCSLIKLIKISSSKWQCIDTTSNLAESGGTSAAAPPPFRPGNPALCGSRPLVTPYNCRLGDLLCLFVCAVFVCYFVSVCICVICVFFVFFFLYSFLLQYIDTVGWVFHL